GGRHDSGHQQPYGRLVGRSPRIAATRRKGRRALATERKKTRTESRRGTQTHGRGHATNGEGPLVRLRHLVRSGSSEAQPGIHQRRASEKTGTGPVRRREDEGPR